MFRNGREGSNPSSGTNMIRNEEQYEKLLEMIQMFWNSKKGTPEGDFLEKLINLVVEYEKIHYPI